MKLKLDEIKTLINETVKEELSGETLPLEPPIKVVKLCSGQETSFGSPEHVADLQRTLAGLENIKQQFWDKRGSTNRYILSTVCSRLKKLIDKFNPPTE